MGKCRKNAVLYLNTNFDNGLIHCCYLNMAFDKTSFLMDFIIIYGLNNI